MKTRLWNRLSIRLIISISVIIITILSIPNSGKITFKIDEDADYVVIRIINEDTEISEKNMPHIFLHFYSNKEKGKSSICPPSGVYEGPMAAMKAMAPQKERWT